MLFDPDKLDDNDPRKIAFLKQQEDQRQRAQKQPADQENSDKVRPNPNTIATITPTKSAVVASNGNGDEDPNAIATITPTKSAVVASNGDEEEEKVHPLNNPVFNESLDVTGIELPTNVFMHGHLYVGCGRTGNPDELHIYANQDGFDNIRDAHLNPDVSYVQNVVWPELLIPH